MTRLFIGCGGEMEGGDPNQRINVALQCQEVCLLASQVMQRHHRIVDAHGEAMRQNEIHNK
jgi:hypothetical protein